MRINTALLLMVGLLLPATSWADPPNCVSLLSKMEDDGFRQEFSATGDRWRSVEFRPSDTSNIEKTGHYEEVDTRETVDGELTTNTNIVKCTDDGILIASSQSSDESTGHYEAYDPPVLWVPITELANSGYEWSWKGTLRLGPSKEEAKAAEGSAQGKVIGNETVDTPLGPIETTHIRLVMSLTAPGVESPVEITIDSWVDIGPRYRVVKREMKSPGFELGFQLEEEHFDKLKDPDSR